MVKIRLMRIGAKKRPFYRVVAVDERKRRNGQYIELLGTYNPLTEPKEIILKKDRIAYWQGQGAVLSDGYLRITKQAPQKPPRKPKKEKATKPSSQNGSEKPREPEDQNIGESENQTSDTPVPSDTSDNPGIPSPSESSEKEPETKKE